MALDLKPSFGFNNQSNPDMRQDIGVSNNIYVQWANCCLQNQRHLNHADWKPKYQGKIVQYGWLWRWGGV